MAGNKDKRRKQSKDPLTKALRKATKRTPRKPIPYDMILERAKARLKWAQDSVYGTAMGLLKEAETLIELLEIHNCGSIRGFDSHRGINQQDLYSYTPELEDRLRWLDEVR